MQYPGPLRLVEDSGGGEVEAELDSWIGAVVETVEHAARITRLMGLYRHGKPPLRRPKGILGLQK